MLPVVVQRIPDAARAPANVLEDLTNALERVRERAFAIFSEKGARAGQAIEDWLQAERELLACPPAELAEDDASYTIQVAAPNIAADDLQVTAMPNEIVVRGKHAVTPPAAAGQKVHFSDFPARDLWRRFELPDTIDLDQVTAKVDKGLLSITAPKAIMQSKRISVAAA